MSDKGKSGSQRLPGMPANGDDPARAQRFRILQRYPELPCAVKCCAPVYADDPAVRPRDEAGAEHGIDDGDGILPGQGASYPPGKADQGNRNRHRIGQLIEPEASEYTPYRIPDQVTHAERPSGLQDRPGLERRSSRPAHPGLLQIANTIRCRECGHDGSGTRACGESGKDTEFMEPGGDPGGKGRATRAAFKGDPERHSRQPRKRSGVSSLDGSTAYRSKSVTPASRSTSSSMSNCPVYSRLSRVRT